MEKLITKLDKMQIICDNPECDFTEEIASKDIIKFRNKPCPICEQNLLTDKDLYTYIKMIEYVDFINKWFSWLTIFWSKKKIEQRRNVASVHYHEGKVTIKSENK